MHETSTGNSRHGFTPRRSRSALTIATCVVIAAGCSAQATSESTGTTAQASLVPFPPPPTVPLGPTCIDIRRGSAYGDVADSSLFPYYPTWAVGTSDRIYFSNWVPQSPSASFADGLIKFSINPLPAGSSVLTAEVVLKPIDPIDPGDIEVYLLQKNWDESTVTPQTFPLSGAYASPAIRTAPISGTNWVRIDVTQQAIDWTSGNVPNDGLLLVDATPWNPAGTGVIRSVGSSESDHQPYLHICYETSPCSGQPNYQSCSDATHCIAGGFCWNGACIRGQAAAAGTVCRPVPNGCNSLLCFPQPQCKQAEVCDGVNAQCPAPTLNPAGTLCRGAQGACDVAAACDGAAIECPSNTYLPSSHVCRPSAGACDVAESCTGSSAYCPADAFQPSSDKCGVASGLCELDAYCTGTTAQCPAKALRAAGTVCHQGQDGFCSPSAYCDGHDASCNIPAGEPNGTSCGSGGGQCEGGACQSCGQTGQPCCATGTACKGNSTCQNGTCEAPPSCGQVDQPCCANQQCPGSPSYSHPIACNTGNNMCVPCGDNSQICCYGSTGCNDPNYGCVAPGNPFAGTCRCETQTCPQGN